ncbi:MAG TPA: 4a-hydroxytetrahydrobiopterin dehydratase [Elusimicrobiota bacterium]|nr:4a-hydroxytetrahydrobiopterin dehydratase [Elusimicrobiota bacterium]
MTKAEARRRLAKLPDWTLAPNGKSIRRELVLKDFLAAVALIRRVATVAEAAGHHPDLHLTGYRKLKIVISTHEAGGLSPKDFRLAAEIDELLPNDAR